MTINYRDLIARHCPPVLKHGYGERLVGVLALMFDTLAEGMRQAVRIPWVGDAEVGPSVDSLGLSGSELSLPRYPSETAAQYTARQERAWVDWTTAGHESSILGQLAAIGLTAHIKYNHDWNWDSQPENWSRFWVVVTSHPWSIWQWGDGSTWGGGQAWGFDATSVELLLARDIVRKWKTGTWVCKHIVIVLDETQWNIDSAAMSGDWDYVLNRSAAAAYVDG